MKKNRSIFLSIFFVGISWLLVSCDSGKTNESDTSLLVRAFLTDAQGAKLEEVDLGAEQMGVSDMIHLMLDTSVTFQSITGFGGAFTESTANTFFKLGQENQDKILDLYFGSSGARYSLCRTHMNSCDFSVGSYSYAPVAGDTALEHFSIFEDTADIIPLIHLAQKVSEDGFKLIASPWTAPPWMKDNNEWFGGKLKPEYYDAWAKFFVKYALAMKEHGAPIWAFTVENEPLGNDAHWESMHYSPEEMAEFVKDHLGPELGKIQDAPHILVYDQNRDEELIEWANVLLRDTQVLEQIYGTAVHWYSSTIDWMPEALQYVHDLAPAKHIIHTEACIDADTPRWNNDTWYWSAEATDWGFQWAAPDKKKDHPKYVPVFRYARDIIGCLNNQVEGWVDWNMVLDRQGGPNHVGNWCIAPMIADVNTNELYITPLYYTMAHFSKFIEPGAKRIKFELDNDDIMATAVRNPDGTVVLVLFNPKDSPYSLEFGLGDGLEKAHIPAKSIQTFVIG